MTARGEQGYVQQDSGSTWRRRTLRGLACLAPISVALVVGFRLSAPDWATAIQRAASSPYAWLSLAIYMVVIAFFPPPARQPSRGRTIVKVLWEYWTGLGGLIFAVHLKLFSGGWETLCDVLIVVGATLTLGDNWLRLTHAPESPETSSEADGA